MKKVLRFMLLLTMLFGITSVAYADELPTANDEMLAEVEPGTVPIVLGEPTTIIVYRNLNACFVYDQFNQLLAGFVVSTGRPDHPTPLGVYRIYAHATGSGYHPMVDGTYGRWCMRFKEGGYMFHSVCYAHPGDVEPIAEEVTALGTSVSRGCIRLNVSDAEWLYNATPNGCTVIIVDG